MSKGGVALLAGLFLLMPARPASGARALQMKWAELPAIVGRTISIALPEGAMVQGKSSAVTDDYLEIQITKSSNAAAIPRGTRRIPLAELRNFQLHKRRKLFRIIGTSTGLVAGLVAGVGVAIPVDGLFGKTSAGGSAAIIGLTAAGATGGYLIGRAADRQAVTIFINP